MKRKAFFSFHYDDVMRVSNVRQAFKIYNPTSILIPTFYDSSLKPGAGKLFEDIPISSFTPKHMRVLRDRKADLPEAAKGRIKSLRAVFAWATKKDVELALTNPARDVDYFKSGSEGFHSWTEDEIARFEETHPVGTKARLALALMLYTSQRRSDIVLFGRQHVSNGCLRFTQQKNREKAGRARDSSASRFAGYHRKEPVRRSDLLGH